MSSSRSQRELPPWRSGSPGAVGASPGPSRLSGSARPFEPGVADELAALEPTPFFVPRTGDRPAGARRGSGGEEEYSALLKSSTRVSRARQCPERYTTHKRRCPPRPWALPTSRGTHLAKCPLLYACSSGTLRRNSALFRLVLLYNVANQLSRKPTRSL